MDHDNVKIIFVIPANCESHHEASGIMHQTFDACKNNNMDCKWCTEEECLDFGSLKTNFFIFQEFSGKTFNKIRSSKSVILGPWCLLTCLTEGKRIPNFSWPIYSVAMMGCTIAFSSLTKPEKKELQEKVEYMGGYVSASLMESCTHLVTNSVKSEKYIKAAEAGKKIMLSSWVTDVWEASLKANVHGDNQQFSKHICPVFYNLVVCCTGLSNVQRNELKQVITEHAGIYKEQLHVHRTDIIVTESRTLSAKSKAAKKYNIKCVTMLWVEDSIKNGYAMPDTDYQIQIGTSTPTKEGTELPNFSMISCIIGNATELNLKTGIELSETIDATQMSKVHSPMKGTPSLKRKSNSNEHNELVDEINLKEVKRAGAFLDGCRIYLVGFGTEQREKLCKILNFSGATRYNDISERVTHVVVGDENCQELKYMRTKTSMLSCPLVSINWLLASLTQESPVDEERFLIGNISQSSEEPGSPLSKKSLHLLQNAPEIAVPDVSISAPVSAPAPEIDIVQQYLTPYTSGREDTLAKLLNEDSKFNTKTEENMNQDHQKSTKTPKVSIQPERDASLSSAIDDDSSQPPEPVFQGLKFLIEDFTQEERKQVKITIEEMSGTVVPKKYKGVVDYAVVPTFNSVLTNAATYVVNDLWITECWHENEVRPVEYFHQPISIDENAKPLKDCVVTISAYSNYERTFVKKLILQLGGAFQDLFSRLDTKDGLKASTHLVTPEAAGKKYAAAVKWGLPVISKDWLLECAQTSKYAPESPYLIGNAKPSFRSNSSSVSSLAKSSSTTPVESNRFVVPRTISKLADIPTTKNQPCQTPPLTKAELPNNTSTENEETPLARRWNHVGNPASPMTPIQKIIAEARKKTLPGTPPDQSLPRPLAWDHVDTPNTPLGAFINPNPSPDLRKQMYRFLNTFPDYKPRRNSTPLSELKRRLWDKICPPKDGDLPNQPNFDVTLEDAEESISQNENNVETISTTPSAKMNVADSVVNEELKQLQEMVTASGGNRSKNRRMTIPTSAPELSSQPNTIGWDECVEEDNKKRVFMLSGVDQSKRTQIISQLKTLGATVSNSLNFDPASTHLICSNPSRNEKILASMSAGKWILHESYVEECVSQGKFVDEEQFEFGNPQSSNNIHMQNEKENDNRLAAVHYWRKEVSRRGYGAFNDMRLIVVAQKREPLVRVLQAGGAMVIDASPPFTETVHATHCLLDLRCVSDVGDYIPLAQQGVFCVNTVYVNDFLLKKGIDVRDYIIPYLSEYHES